MTITVEIPSELEAELAAQARARGMDVPAYAATVIEGAVQPTRATKRLTPERLKRILSEMGQFSHKIPVLPDEAFTRESLYEDHD